MAFEEKCKNRVRYDIEMKFTTCVILDCGNLESPGMFACLNSLSKVLHGVSHEALYIVAER